MYAIFIHIEIKTCIIINIMNCLKLCNVKVMDSLVVKLSVNTTVENASYIVSRIVSKSIEASNFHAILIELARM